MCDLDVLNAIVEAAAQSGRTMVTLSDAESIRRLAEREDRRDAEIAALRAQLAEREKWILSDDEINRVVDERWDATAPEMQRAIVAGAMSRYAAEKQRREQAEAEVERLSAETEANSAENDSLETANEELSTQLTAARRERDEARRQRDEWAEQAAKLRIEFAETTNKMSAERDEARKEVERLKGRVLSVGVDAASPLLDELKHLRDFVNSVGVVNQMSSSDSFVREHVSDELKNLQWKLDEHEESNEEAMLRTIGELQDETAQAFRERDEALAAKRAVAADAAAMRPYVRCLYSCSCQGKPASYECSCGAAKVLTTSNPGKPLREELERLRTLREMVVVHLKDYQCADRCDGPHEDCPCWYCRMSFAALKPTEPAPGKEGA